MDAVGSNIEVYEGALTALSHGAQEGRGILDSSLAL